MTNVMNINFQYLVYNAHNLKAPKHNSDFKPQP